MRAEPIKVTRDKYLQSRDDQQSQGEGCVLCAAPANAKTFGPVARVPRHAQQAAMVFAPKVDIALPDRAFSEELRNPVTRHFKGFFAVFALSFLHTNNACVQSNSTPARRLPTRMDRFV